ncbi:MAG: hypothetical protein ACFFCI_02195 [Promethearchaeota archaeon]
MDVNGHLRDLILGERGCGEVKLNAFYAIMSEYSEICDRLPLAIPECLVCGERPKFSRGITPIDPLMLFGVHPTIDFKETCDCEKTCFVCYPPNSDPEGVRHFIMWVGDKYYQGNSFLLEAQKQGISKRLPSQIPFGLVPLKSIIYLAKQNYKEDPKGDFDLKDKKRKVDAIILAYRPIAIIYTITKEQSMDEDLMATLKEEGYTPIIVPDNHPSIKYGKKPKSLPYGHKKLRNGIKSKKDKRKKENNIPIEA